MTISLPEKFIQPLLISEGNYGTVFRAKQETLNRFVAIKELKEVDSAKRKELINEAMIQADLGIPTVPHIHDAFEFNNKVYIVMEWIGGITLSHYLINKIDINGNIFLCRDLIASVAEVHKRGYAHRDIKPENILLSGKELPVLVDFGLAKHAIYGKRSTEGLIKGTPDYMAPELWTSGPNVDLFKADVFSLAKVISFLLHSPMVPTVLNSALSLDPFSRPENAQDMLRLWDEECIGYKEEDNYSWRKWADQTSNEFLYTKKIEAINEYIRLENFEDAYWLCVECINERPDSDEALLNLQIIEDKKKKKSIRRKRIVSSSILISMLILVSIIVTSVLLYKQKEGIHINNDVVSSQSMIKTVKKTKRINYEYINKKSSYEYIWLKSQLQILNIPSDSKLYLDKKEVEYLNNNAKFTLNYGEYLIEIFKDQNVLWREKIFLAPFQKVRIGIK